MLFSRHWTYRHVWGVYGLLITYWQTPDKRVLGPGLWRFHRHSRDFGGKFKILSFLPTSTIWLSTDYPGPKQSRLYILSWLGTPRTLRTRVCRGPSAFFVPPTILLKAEVLPVTPTIWVSIDSPGHQQSRFGIFSWLKTTWTLMTPRSLLFCSKSQQYGCLQTPLDPSNQDLAFWVDSGPPGNWGL